MTEKKEDKLSAQLALAYWPEFEKIDDLYFKRKFELCHTESELNKLYIEYRDLLEQRIQERERLEQMAREERSKELRTMAEEAKKSADEAWEQKKKPWWQIL